MNKLQLMDQKGFPIIKSSVNAVYQTDWQGRNLLYSTPRTNVCLYSNQFSSGPWKASSAGVGAVPILTANYGTAPDGSLTATRLQLALNGGTTSGDRSYIHQIINGLAQAVPYVHSIWIKSLSGTCTVLYYDDYAPSGTQRTTVTEDWTLISLEITPGSNQWGAQGLWLIGSLGSSNSADLLIWSAQTETGSTPTPRIPTTTAPVTVIDYADNGDGTVTLGQDTPDTSTFQWSGTGISKGETELSPYNVSVSQQIINPVVGSNNILQLVDSTGFPLSAANIQSIYKTDWQGRQLLYGTPRTNTLTQSEFPNGLSDAPLYGGNVSAATGLGWPGGITTGIAFTSNSVVSYAYKTINLGGTSPPITFSVILKMDDGGAPVIGGSGTGDLSLVINNDPNPADTITALGGGLYRCSRTIAYNNAGYNYGVVKYATQSARTFVVSGYQLEVSPVVTSYIKTGASTVTVTDYADNGDGTVALGQYAANTDVYDWSGTGVGWR